MGRDTSSPGQAENTETELEQIKDVDQAGSPEDKVKSVHKSPTKHTGTCIFNPFYRNIDYHRPESTYDSKRLSKKITRGSLH